MKTHLILATVAVAAVMTAQEAPADRLQLSFRDPSRPGTVQLSLTRGSITVKSHSGTDVIVQAVSRSGPGDDKDKTPPPPPGMRRIYDGSSRISAEEENNVMRISLGIPRESVDVTISVPPRTSLKLHTLRGSITVEGVEGDIEVNSTRGPITLTGVSGSVVAHALHGELVAVIQKADPSKPMSFSSLHGKIDVTLPADIKADLKLRSSRGSVFSDFDVVMEMGSRAEEGKAGGPGKYKVTSRNDATGKINGGGQEITFKNMDGTIYVRKGK